MFVVPVVYSLDIFSGEMSNRTIHLLFKIPVSRPAIFFSKFLLSVASIFLIFLLSGILMELVSGGREVWTFYLLKKNLVFGCTAVMLFTWFTPFGCRSRSEAGSLAAMFGVLIGLAIVYFSADMCEIGWAMSLMPYTIVWMEGLGGSDIAKAGPLAVALLQVILFPVVTAIACFRYTRIRRYL
jgi:ABC-type transport system involved in multi-copper enzyme maturation permease subunit